MSHGRRAPRLPAGVAALLTAVYGCSLAVDTDGLSAGGADAGGGAGGGTAPDASTDAALGADGGASFDAGTDAPVPVVIAGDGITDTACIPKTCAAQGIQCGDAGDGCGRELDCGGCHHYGDVCASGACGCSPKTSASGCTGLCGAVPDGCGGFFSCSECVGGMSCGPDNTCSLRSCTPTSTPQNACGMFSDGCGGTRTAANGTSCPTNNVNNGCNAGPVPASCGCFGSSCAQQGFSCSIPGSEPVGDLCQDPDLACGGCTYPPGQCNAQHLCNTCTRVAAPAYPYDTQCTAAAFPDAWACDCGDGGSCFVPDGFSAAPQTCQLQQVTREHAIYCCAKAP